MKKYISTCAQDTERIAGEVARTVKKGSVVLLTGELGAGKTLFANAFARELGITEHLLSPTFTIVREYEGLYHFDLYRIEEEEELFMIGFEEYLLSGNYCLIEWANKFPDMFDEHAVKVCINYTEDGREIIVG